MENKLHWENIYGTKRPNEVSWTQEIPQTSLDFIRSFNLDKTASIIDVGGGDSKLVDYLLEGGFVNITVLDISTHALERAKERLGTKAEKVKWVVEDITTYKPDTKFDVWHDRAAFHFLVTKEQIETYLNIAKNAVKPNGYVTIGTFSENGPKKCSGLDIKQYSEASLQAQLTSQFVKLKCITEDHTTPFSTTQNFLFCSFQNIFGSHKDDLQPS
jgi:ubiquinone/menaquinone biosynthesis C-methylase UbiE